MAFYRIVSTRFWDDTFIADLEPVEKLLFLYFLTNPRTNISGVYEISVKRIAFDTGIDKEMVLKIIERFSKANKIHYIDGNIVINNFLKYQATKSKKVKKGIIRELENQNPELLKKILKLDTLLIPYLNGMDILSRGMDKQNETKRNETETKLKLNKDETETKQESGKSINSGGVSSKVGNFKHGVSFADLKSVRDKEDRLKKYIYDGLVGLPFKPSKIGEKPSRFVKKDNIEKILKRIDLRKMVKYLYYSKRKNPKYLANYFFYAIENEFAIPDEIEDEAKQFIRGL
jgi:hypothetical protein